MKYPFIKCLHPIQVKTSKGVTLVPCGHCAACESRKKSDLQLRIQIEAEKYKHTYFITATYDDEHLPLFSPYLSDESFYNEDTDLANCHVLPNKGMWLCNQSRVRLDGFSNFNDCHDSITGLNGRRFVHPFGDIIYQKGSILGMLYDYHRYLGSCKNSAFTHRYAAHVTSWYTQISSPFMAVPLLYYKDIQNFMKRLRKQLSKIDKNEKVRYYIVGEYGTKSLRPHFHILLFTNSDSIANEFKYTTREVTVLATKDRRFYTNSYLYKTWQFGYCTIDKADGKAAGYVSNYVVGSSLLPKLLQELAPQKTFHSINFGLPYTKEQSLSMLRRRDFERFSQFEYVDTNDANRVKSRSLWRSYHLQFFPTFTGSSSLSNIELYQVFKSFSKLASYFFESDVEKLARKIALCIRHDSLGLSDESEHCIAKFFDWFELTPNTFVSLSSLKSILYASKRALSISHSLGITLYEYTKLYTDFISWRDAKCLAEHYRTCAQDCEYLFKYYDIFGPALNFNENLFDRYRHSYLFNFFRRDVEALSFTRVKHKEVFQQIKMI